MNISSISFKSAYKIKCKDTKQAQKIKKTLPENINFAQNGNDVIIIEDFDNNKKIVMKCLKENTDAHDKNMNTAAIEAYKKHSGMEPGQLVDTYR